MPIVLLAIELMIPMANKMGNDVPNIIDTIQQCELRDVLPNTAEILEKDSERILAEMATAGVSQSRKSVPDPDKAQKDLLQFASLVYLILIIIGVLYFSIRPLRNILRSRKIWQHEMVWQNANADQAPFVPSQSSAWQWKSQSKFRAAASLYYVIGGIIHIAANVFCFESLNYVIFSRCLIFESIANLWSWVFVICRIVFGHNIGQGFAIMLVLVVSLPLLLLASVILRRLWSTLRFAIRVLWNGCFTSRNPSLPHTLQQAINLICKQHNLKEPLILINQSHKSVPLRLWYLPLIGYSVIEVHDTLLNLLTEEELKAALAHELGHLHSGQIKIALMKWLSSLALFPNYYLAICINWAQLEMEADQFAIGTTKNPSALKHALVKISTAQISYKSSTNKNESHLLNKIRGIRTALRYYFGDGLLGYAHPRLTERLAAIDKNEIK